MNAPSPAATGRHVVRPGTDEYERVRRPALARFADRRPAAIAPCATPADVAATIALARDEGLPLAVRSGGHCFAGTSSTGGVLIDVSPMRGVTAGDGQATIGAGTLLGEVYDALDAHGVTIPAGCGPEVGIAGLTLGGGLGILGRLHGLTSDRLRAAVVVLADGRVVTCDDARHPDLFWALRGAGGARFGVVTELRFATVLAPDCTAFELLFAPAAAERLLAAWQRWSPAAPDELAASLLVSADEDGPRVAIIGAMAADRAMTERTLGELSSAAEATPTASTLRHGSSRAAKRFLSALGAEDDERHLFNRSEYFARELPAEVVHRLVAGVRDEPARGFSRELDFTPWGGAYNRTPSDATAFAHRDARFLLKQAVAVEPGAPGMQRAAVGWLERSWALAHPSGTGGVYPNFPEAGRDPWSVAYHGPNRARLTEIKRRYDPGAIFGPAPAAAPGPARPA